MTTYHKNPQARHRRSYVNSAKRKKERRAYIQRAALRPCNRCGTPFRGNDGWLCQNCLNP